MKSVIVQLAFTFVLTIQTAILSFSVVWPSYSSKVLESEDSPLGFPMSKSESSLVGSIPMLGSVVATLVAGIISDAIGRKKAVILTSLFFVVSWSLIITARSTIQMLIGRLLIGIGSGMTIVVIFIFTGEITQLSVRGSAASQVALMYNVGILVSYLQGWFCSYKMISYMSVTASVAYTVIVCCLKETPVYLLKIGKEKEALISLKFYRGESNTTEAILEELSNLKSQTSNENKFTDLEKSNKGETEKLSGEKDILAENEKNENPWKLLFTVDYNRRALITVVTLMVLCVLMGMIAVQTYAAKFFSLAAPTMSPDFCSVLLAVALVLSSGITMLVTNLVSRRFLMISTCIVATACLAVLGSLLRWSWGPVWIAPLVIMLFCLTYHLGCINIAFVQLSESFGPQVNSAATAIVLCSVFVMNFIVLVLFVPLVDSLGIDGTFFSFAVIGVITTIVSTLIVKETRQVPLEKVQQMYAQGYLYRKCET